MKKIGVRTRQVWKFIADYYGQHGYPPVVREIAQALGFRSLSTVVFHLARLEEEGYLHRRKSSSRSVEILVFPAGTKVGDVQYLPLVGNIPAGEPLEAFENIEETIPFPSQLAGPGFFLLKVRGDSMKGRGILDGDLVLVKPQPTAEDGDVVVVLVGGEATVKVWRKKAGGYWLEPANPHFKPIPFTEGKIIGKVVGLFRSLEKNF